MVRQAWRWALVLAALLGAASSGRAADAVVDRSYFGFHAHRLASSDAWPSVDFGSWRLWDAYVSWPHLEPEAERWTFQVLDRYVAMAAAREVDILLPLGLSPTWASARPTEPSAYQKPGWAAEPASLAAWERYVRTVAVRYKGRIRHYEIWNEPNLKRFFSGDVGTMVRLACAAARVLREADPAARLVSPAATDRDQGVEWLRAFMRQGGADCVDVVGFHFYTLAHEGPEAMLPHMRAVRDIARTHGDKPVWNTETGWYFANARIAPKTRYRIRDAEEATAFVMRAHLLGAAMGVQRFFWYAWDNHTMGGLIEPDSGEAKPAVKGLATIIRWLVGARIGACAAGEDGVWSCPVEDRVRGRAWLVWHPDRPLRWRLPARLTARAYAAPNAAGVVAADRSVAIGPTPILLTDEAAAW